MRDKDSLAQEGPPLTCGSTGVGVGIRGVARVGDGLGTSVAGEVVDVKRAVFGGVGTGVGSGMGPKVRSKPYSPCLKPQSVHTTTELPLQPCGLL